MGLNERLRARAVEGTGGEATGGDPQAYHDLKRVALAARPCNKLAARSLGEGRRVRRGRGGLIRSREAAKQQRPETTE